MPISAPGDPNITKMQGNLLAGIGNLGSLVMPGTPSLPNLPSKASVSPPLSPQVRNCRLHYVSCSPIFLNIPLSTKGTKICSIADNRHICLASGRKAAKTIGRWSVKESRSAGPSMHLLLVLMARVSKGMLLVQSEAVSSAERVASCLQDSMTPLGRQLEMCLARQVQVQNAKRHGPLQVLMSEEQMAAAAAAAAGGNPQRFGWPHNSQQSLDSQVCRIQLAQAALEKADMFKVPSSPCTCCNLCQP